MSKLLKHSKTNLSLLALAISSSAFSADYNFVLKPYAQANVSIDNSSAKGPGATKGTSLKSNASRFGIKGNTTTSISGAKLIYQVELQADVVGTNNAGQVFRESYVGLKNKELGKIRLGRLTVGYKSSYTKMDVWTDHVLQARQSGQQGVSNLNSNYFNNAISYTSPKLGALEVNAFAAMHEDSSIVRMHNSGKLVDFLGGSASGIGVKYNAGGLRLTADTLNINSDSITVGKMIKNGSALKFGAMFKVSDSLTVAGHYEDVTGLNLGTNIWTTAQYKMSKLALLTASYGINDGTTSNNAYMSATKGTANTFSIGAKYKLTKKSALIVGYNSHKRDGSGGDNSQTITIGIDSKFGY